ncbi:MAG TPA: hypothetical protein VFD78_04245 [Chitinophagaceae bacterium]|nr:hypothetical protein [Chitinophagaceae bacterium]
MKSLFHKVLSLLMAILVLFNTMSFAVDIHFCGDDLIDFSFIQNVADCGMEEVTIASCHEDVDKASCCKDDQIVVESEDDVQLTIDQISFEQQVFLASFVYTYFHLVAQQDDLDFPHKYYVPPLLIRDIQKLHETYLI